MSKEIFKVLEPVEPTSSKEEILCEKYRLAAIKISEEINNGNGIITNANFKDILKKFMFYCVKYISLSRYKEEYKIGKMKTTLNESEIISELTFIDNTIKIMSLFTPTELLQMFPVIKTYDGEKWGEKDYFFTMDLIKQYDPNVPIGSMGIKNMLDLLWNYMNDDLSQFLIAKFSITNYILKLNGEMGIIEQFMDENGLPSYILSVDGKSLIDCDTGEEIAIKQNTNFRVVNGGTL